MTAVAGFPKDATIKIYDSPTATGSDNNILSTSPITLTTEVYAFEESGFEANTEHISTLGGNYVTVFNGRSDIELSFSMRVVGSGELFENIQSIASSTNDIFENDTAKFYIEIDFTELGMKKRYSNLSLKSYTETADVDGMLECEVLFTAPAFDKTNLVWNKVKV